MKRLMSLLAMLIFITTACAQTDVYSAVDKMPEPVGGIQAIGNNLTYPEEAKLEGLEGKVFVKAVIDQNGNVVKTEIIKSTNTIFDIPAKDAVEKTKFTPGEHKGKKVKVEVTIPIMFKLADKEAEKKE
jgi:protein TonB